MIILYECSDRNSENILPILGVIKLVAIAHVIKIIDKIENIL